LTDEIDLDLDGWRYYVIS